MPNGSFGTRARALAAGMALVAVTAACTPVKDWLYGKETGDSSPTVGSEYPGLYVREMYAVASGDPAAQAEIYADAAAAARLTPDPVSRLRFALVLATPGHAGSDPQQAQTMLRELLAQPELLTSLERSLAVIYLQQVEERLVLDAEARRLRVANSRSERTEAEAVALRIAAVEAENRHLRESLAEAEQKLEAITTIERSIREQSDDNDNQQ